MVKECEQREEVKVFEYNAKEGARAVAFWWLFRKLLLPLILFFTLLVVAAWMENGPIAGLLSAAIFATPIVILVLFSKGQFEKIARYFRK
ncbi:hypothetical protein J7413_01065 [Shimia sp. R10_1]|uniref:hypothetical protein n=1 Tax=Shimia sp. R10_1 TaxID=2821095 RepID=UPI001ADB7D28|nr:hypothetical protein [Shimia sp. R10_1]MBO9472118.1 hypothetical protein [Shimia sp. R10_1]